MNNVINYIIKNDKITNIQDDIIKIIFFYNYRYNKNLHWINIIWVKFPKIIENYLIKCYINETIYDIKNYKNFIKPYENYIRKILLSLNKNTFIKFLYDNNYLSENILILLSKVPIKNYGLYGNILIYDYLINKNDMNIKLLDNSDYINLGVFIDKNVKYVGIYFKELIKINNKFWIILTGYKEIVVEEEKESIKIISWIFSKEL